LILSRSYVAEYYPPELVDSIVQHRAIVESLAISDPSYRPKLCFVVPYFAFLNRVYSDM